MDNKAIQMRFSAYELDRIVVAMLANVSNLKFIQNIKALFDMFDIVNDEQKAARICLIKTLADHIITNNIRATDILLNTVTFNGRYADKEIEILNSVYSQEIMDKESVALDKKISQLLKFATIERTTDALVNNINNIKSENYDDLGEEIDKVENEINNIQKTLRDYNDSIDDANNTVSFDNTSFLSRVQKVIEKAKNPSSTIRTGIQMLNNILGGGFKAGRVVCCMAPMKNWKSGLLFNSCIWAKKYNILKPKDPTKRPVILYISLENTMDETIERLGSYCQGNHFQMKDHNLEEVAKIFEAADVWTPNDDSAPMIEMMYKPNKSITVGDIGTIIDNFEKQGKEVMFLAVDYIKRIRPSVTTKDLRIDLGSIADDLHVLAVEKDIPIFTAMQLNRNAIAEMDAAQTFDQKLAAFGRIGASNVGESIDIPQNVDLTFTMVKTVDPKISENGDIESVDKYINFHVVAARYNIGDVDSFIHRFKDGNDMALEEDVVDANGNMPLSKSIINKQVLIKDRVAETGIKTKGPRHV